MLSSQELSGGVVGCILLIGGVLLLLLLLLLQLRQLLAQVRLRGPGERELALQDERRLWTAGRYQYGLRWDLNPVHRAAGEEAVGGDRAAQRGPTLRPVRNDWSLWRRLRWNSDFSKFNFQNITYRICRISSPYRNSNSPEIVPPKKGSLSKRGVHENVMGFGFRKGLKIVIQGY